MPKTMTVEEKKSLHVEVLEKISMFLSAAFGFVVGLAWNTAVQDLLSHWFPSGKSLAAEFIYAVALTVIVALATFLFGQMVGKMKATMK